MPSDVFHVGYSRSAATFDWASPYITLYNSYILTNTIPVLWSFCYANSGLDSVAASQKQKGGMSPRKCPIRAPALLAAKHANTQKSTGPGTAGG